MAFTVYKMYITVPKLVQQQATKYIISDYPSSYKACLITLKSLPLMMQFEVLLFVNGLKKPMNTFNIYEYVTFSIVKLQSVLLLSN